MTETPEPATRPTSPVAAQPAVERVKPPRLYTAAAWVVIVAGIVFILSTVFFAGAVILGHSHHCYPRYYHGVMYGPGPYGGPGMYPPGYGPGGPAGPSQSPTPPTPQTPSPRP